jgi:hypothetical protein
MDSNGKYLISFGNTYSLKRVYRLLKTFEYIYHQDQTIKLIISFKPQDIYNLKIFPQNLIKTFLKISLSPDIFSLKIFLIILVLPTLFCFFLVII